MNFRRCEGEEQSRTKPKLVDVYFCRGVGPATSTDGLQPAAPLLEGSDGALYGTTVTGGGNAVGSVFKLKKDGSGYTKLYAFGFNDSAVNPYAGLIEGSDKALYGTAAGGPGGVFKLNEDGSGYQILRGFNDARPFAPLVKGRDAALYGTTFQGGDRPFGIGTGTVFRLNEDGSGYRIVYSFSSSGGDGRNRQELRDQTRRRETHQDSLSSGSQQSPGLHLRKIEVTLIA